VRRSPPATPPGRFKEEEAAKAAYKNLTQTALVTEVKEKSATRPAPVPFNTYRFPYGGGEHRDSPSRAARLAEDLYTDGYISYPRTDNTVYPTARICEEVLGQFKRSRAYRAHAERLAAEALADARTKADHGHPPIYPTARLKRRCVTISGRSISSSCGVSWLP
jgi:DNA topoisomerase-1